MRVNERRVQGRKERPTERKAERKEGGERGKYKRGRERERAVSLSTRGRLGIGGEKETDRAATWWEKKTENRRQPLGATRTNAGCLKTDDGRKRCE